MLLNELIRKDEQGNQYVSARELHKLLGLKNRFSIWFNQKINSFELEFPRDGAETKAFVTIGKGNKRLHDDFNLTLDTCIRICSQKNAGGRYEDILQVLYLAKGEKIRYKELQRRGIEFGNMLETFFGNYGIEFENEVNVCNGKYRIDFLYGDIAIEYDEEYHETPKQKQLDETRTKEIDEWFLEENTQGEETPFIWIRVKAGEELLGISEINRIMIKYGILQGEGGNYFDAHKPAKLKDYFI